VGTSPERWRSVEELYQAALDLPSGQRAAWLKEACADEELQREVESQVSKARFTARFEREARAIAAFNHPNIRTIHDVGPNYLVMELIDGVPVKGPLPVKKAVEYAGQIFSIDLTLECHSPNR